MRFQLKFILTILLTSLLFTTLTKNRPLLITNLFGIVLPILSPFLHLKNLFSFPQFEVDLIPTLATILTPNEPFDLNNIPPAPDYTNDSSWGALWPRIDTADLISKNWYTANSDTTHNIIDDPIQQQTNSRCDVFYLHPTTYFNANGWNGK